MKFETGWIHYRDLRSEDGDGNDKVKKPIGLIRKTTTASHASRIFVNFFVVTANYEVKMANFTFRKTTSGHDEIFFRVLVNLDIVLRNSTTREFV